MYEELDVGSHRTQPPPFLYLAAELPRLLGEAASLPMAWSALTANAPKGDGHPVLVLPGFTAGDGSTLLLRRFLTRLGYNTLPWLLGNNRGAPAQLLSLMRRFYRLTQTYDEPISIVGQSLGGVYAREIAREFPDAVRFVVTLGSPFAATSHHSTSPMVARLFESMSGVTVEQMRTEMAHQDSRLPPPVPVSALYSRTDGVVSWRACMERESDLTENIEVIGSHSGMAMHPMVLHVVADRLAQPLEGWRKFDRRCGLRPFIFPDPAPPPAA
ncbi:MAG: alpha/beta hydrolase [Gammaproteobacteria bacterium]|nr:alpha/beta hydrolase [Gammaproteobacteria bacterium]